MMNSVKWVLGICVGMAVMLSSCSKDSDGNIIATKMSATIDGSGWSTISRVTVLTNGIFTITGTTALSESMVITIRGDETGTYELSANLNDLSGQCLCVYSTSLLPTADVFTSTEGVVTLTAVDTSAKTISGTFSFTVYNLTKGTKSIENGVFNNLSYTERSGE
ncbi:hypothetical protein LX69_00501 [Breznakibacter xylanolyticus]|uniref:Uncharacterized protein n=1 Tax=Breznakibacter xylanolyticus TaxID=990 RepID=A0A2W7NJK4_9BACT|nr:DUF6252 family protein [Breznakibacter xylanolyticus]PZX20050.1 hypothetical protein LX69_00501 [Breznakibacter xylanolyticus]